jgi:hypothetical protein
MSRLTADIRICIYLDISTEHEQNMRSSERIRLNFLTQQPPLDLPCDESGHQLVDGECLDLRDDEGVSSDDENPPPIDCAILGGCGGGNDIGGCGGGNDNEDEDDNGEDADQGDSENEDSDGNNDNGGGGDSIEGGDSLLD